MDPAQRRKSSSCSTGTTAGCGCKGKDFGPVQDHEVPSEEDMDRFSGVTRTCPECKTEVYDEAELCHNCGHAFGAATESQGLPTWAVVTMFGVVVMLVFGVMFI